MAEQADLVFHNKAIDGTAMKRLISRLIDHFGMAYTSHILDQIKTLGFQQATATSISLGIDDLLIIPSKGWLVQNVEQQSFIFEKHHHFGNVHAVEKLRQSIEIWYASSEYFRQEMNPNFRMTDPCNPVHIMSFSGARGNASQLHQLVGMRGLMSDPQGQMIDLPIQSNLREGLSLTEYIISCYGARKGVVDTTVRTSDVGYLTRSLVEVVQHIVVRRTDHGTVRGISSHSWAGQSIVELGTQLTLRTFHTGGEFTGGTAEHVRAPNNGKIKFNENLVHPTRTRHGYPVFLCYIDLYVTIEGQDILHHVNIPPQNFILVKNDQYVESEQVIAEIRTEASTLNFKERVRKHIYSDSKGEMHCSTAVYHSPEYTYRNVHLLPKIGHLWILAGVPYRSSIAPLSLYKDQDQINIHSLSVQRKSISNLSVMKDQVIHKLFRLDPYGKKGEGALDYSGPDRILCNGQYNFIYPAILDENSDLLAKRRRNRLIIPLQSNQEKKEQISRSGISIEIPINDIFCRNSILAYFDDPRYRRKSSGITKYGTLEVDSIEVHILPGSSSIMVRNNSIIGVDTRITFNIRSRVVRPVVTYETAGGINLATLFPRDPLQERDNVQLRVVNYILYGNGKPVRGISHTNIRLEVHASFVEVRVNDLIRDVIRMDLVKSSISYTRKRNDPAGLNNYLPVINELFILINKHLLLDKLKQTFQILKYYLMDERGRIYNPDPCNNMILNPFNWNCSFLHHDYCEETSTIISLGQFFCENVCMSKYGPYLMSRQVLIVHVDSFVIRSAKTYLATPGATVHGHYGEILYEGNTLVTFLYANMRSSDITQGLPKVEQVLEVRSIDSISMNLEKRVEGWRELLVLEDGMSNVFSPGELIGLLRTERTGDALEETICYRAALLGITRASLNTQSFISEASFQETARVLAKASLRDQCCSGGMVPVGTGFKGLVHRLSQHNNISLEIEKKNLFEGDMGDILFHHKELFDSCTPPKISRYIRTIIYKTIIYRIYGFLRADSFFLYNFILTSGSVLL
ncbi:hypothetical protein AQUCO_06400062v1 [Aquilegia coerulea]|uniref:DNA-directed RNA polymerase n=1 Tax=Aquilegia coerulea TaxID=218851 RepID=A0A2G5CCJ9_AQUCA|nr:hypothetical protein AQUCO_06400062v1 [Aquilegia coerulea]